MCLFGLYHGLVFLPVLLSLFGPDPYINSNKCFKDLQIVAARGRGKRNSVDTISSHALSEIDGPYVNSGLSNYQAQMPPVDIMEETFTFNPFSTSPQNKESANLPKITVNGEDVPNNYKF